MELNHVFLFGRLTRDPELKTTSTGKQVVSFSLAISRPGTGDATDFIDCMAWDKTAELIAGSCKKGQRLLVWGRLQRDNYNDKQGQARSMYRVVLSSFKFIEPKAEAENVGFTEVTDFDEDAIPF